MNRPLMTIWIGDWLRDTLHLTTAQQGALLLLSFHCWQYGRIPDTDRERAAVARMTPANYSRIKLPIQSLFNSDGTCDWISAAIKKMEVIRIKRQMAGVKGGLYSSMSKARNQPNAKHLLSKSKANHESLVDTLPSERVSYLDGHPRKKGMWNRD